MTTTGNFRNSKGFRNNADSSQKGTVKKFGDGDTIEAGYITFFPSSAQSGPDGDASSQKPSLKLEKKNASEVQSPSKRTNLVVQIPKQALAEAMSSYKAKLG